MNDKDFLPRDYRSRYASLAGMSDSQLEQHWREMGQEAGLVGRLTEAEAAALRRDRFKAADYRIRYSDMEGKSDPEVVEHFLAFGREEGRMGLLSTAEREALEPGNFDADEYRRRYPDLSEVTLAEATSHFLALGRAEKRYGRFTSRDLALPTESIDPTRPTVGIILHEASRSGAPLLAWSVAEQYSDRYNVVIVLRRGGPVLAAFEDIGATVIRPAKGTFDSADELEILAERVAEVYSPTFAVAATSAVFSAVPPFAAHMPLVLLVHEFAPTKLAPQPIRDGVRAAVAAAPTVFSSTTVQQSYLREFDELDASTMHLVRQGLYARPEPTKPPAHDAIGLSKPGSRLVLGVGSVNQRKGVDVFVQAAAAVFRVDPDPDTLRFVWVGNRDSGSPVEYQELLSFQVENSGLGDNFEFIGAVEDLDPFYAAAAVTFVSSRLDPLPNSALDAFGVGVPVVTFDGAGGISEIMNADDDAAQLVVPYLDAAAAASALSRVLTDAEWRTRQSAAARRVLEACLELPAYAEAIAQIVGAKR